MSLQDLSEKFGKDRIDNAKKRLDELAVETPSWGFRRAGTRFGTYTTPTDPETQEAKFAKAGEFFKKTGKSETVALHFPWDAENMDEVRALKDILAKNGIKAGAVNSNLFSPRTASRRAR